MRTSAGSRTHRTAGRIGIAMCVAGLALASVVLGAPTPACAAVEYPPNYNPLLVISDANWRAAYSMSQAEIQAFLNTQPGVLKDYACAEGGPNGMHSQTVKPAAQIIAEAAQYWNVNPKLIIATLEKEQSLISQPWHAGYETGWLDRPPAGSGQTHGTVYHLRCAMGAGCFATTTDAHDGFGDQVWTGAEKLAKAPEADSTSPYAWYPGKVKRVYSYEHAAYIDIVPLNQPTWNFYTYTPYYPQVSVWKCYNKYFGDPLSYPGKAPVYRFYNLTNGSHFYTASETERYVVSTSYASTYRFEGAAYSIATTDPVNATPLYRFYNRRSGSHFYTTSPAEVDNTIQNYSAIYSFEGPAYTVSMTPEGCVPVHRFYNRRVGSHFYTTSPDEVDATIRNYSNLYTYEGIAYWVKLSE